LKARILLLLLAATAVAAPKAEDKLKSKLAKVWIDYARACVGKGAKTEGQRAIELARAADANARDLAKVAESVEALSRDEDPDKTRRAKAHKDAAKVCDKLAKYDPEFTFKALELDPSKTRINKLLGKVKQLAGKRQSVNDAGKLLTRLREAYPEGKYDAIEREMALKDVAVIRGKGQHLVGYLSLPKGWKKNREYDVLVAVDGAGSGFLGCARGFAGARGSRDVIVLAPCTLANTNQLKPDKYPFYSKEVLDEGNRNRFGFDLEGLEALLEVVKERYGGRDKIAITGFSGGGNLCYGWTLVHPDRVLCAAPACANFGGMGLSQAKPVTDGGPPIHIMTGANDKHREFTFGNKNSPGIEPQTDRAVKALKDLGFTNFKRTMLKGKGHSALRPEVWAYYDQVRSRD
jgi:dienelactone hydrolase